jgi:hypothetical protein
MVFPWWNAYHPVPPKQKWKDTSILMIVPSYNYLLDMLWLLVVNPTAWKSPYYFPQMTSR